MEVDKTQFVEVHQINQTKLVVIREPGGQIGIRKIECTVEEAKAIHEQLGALLYPPLYANPV